MHQAASTRTGSAWDNETLLLFDRDPATGALTARDDDPLGCLSRAPLDGCSHVRVPALPRDIEVSADGGHVFVAGSIGELAVLDRATDTGLLTEKPEEAGCFTPVVRENCTRVLGLGGSSTEVVLGPGGAQLYLVATDTGVFTFDVDAETGELTQKEGAAGCLLFTPGTLDCGDLTATGGFARQAALSPDGENLYLPGDDELTILDRDATSGVLTQKPGGAGCLAATGDACTSEPRLAEAHTVVAGPEGAQVYVAVRDGILTFARADDGTLTAQSCVNLDGSDGCADGRNLSRPGYGAISPDGQHLVLSHGDDATR